ncbi:glycosyltransferase family 4 protein [Candidatus Spongiihabitans sp.]|uniref:glycosyltransferase family 4 protein n=1 Tax=Candidatus Spongiihabitans sp. TaxID=3101308 RepID=UPI003C7CB789
MKLAFALFTYFPHGGLTRDAIAIARVCRQRGHQVTMYVGECRGAADGGEMEVRLLPVKARTNHGKGREFAAQLKAAMANEAHAPDLLIGFNKMPGLDVYYAADGCFAEKIRARAWWYQATPRCRHYLDFENAVFANDAATQILMIARNQIGVYQNFYDTQDARMTLLPPGIARDRIAGDDASARRKIFRAQWHLNDNDKLLLALGSGFRTKGLDRTLRALAALPPQVRDKTKLFIVGDDNAAPFEKIVRRLKLKVGVGADAQVRFLGGRDEVPAFLSGADVLLHPAQRENTGSVLLEAMVAGLPVIATDVCGYAHYVRDENMGEVLASPFDQLALNLSLQRLLKVERDSWRVRGREFAKRADIYDMPLHACRRIEEIFARRKNNTT